MTFSQMLYIVSGRGSSNSAGNPARVRSPQAPASSPYPGDFGVIPVKTIVSNRKQAGTQFGKVTVRKSDAFDLTVGKVRWQRLPGKICRIAHHCNSYSYGSL